MNAASGHQERQRRHRHHLEGVDLLGDAHGSEAGGVAAADGGGQCDRGDQWSDLAGVEVRRDERGELRDTYLAQRRVALDPDLGAGEERHERDDADASGDHRESSDTEGDLGKRVQDLAPVALERDRDPDDCLEVEEQLVAALLDLHPLFAAELAPDVGEGGHRVTSRSAGRLGSRWP
jgi:hypothetical protein